MAWVELADLKQDLGIAADDDRDDKVLQDNLDAAVVFVERVRRGYFNFTEDPLVGLPEPSADVKLGTVRLAGRYYTRRRSPDGLIQAAEMGSSKIPSFDRDIERLLRIGRHAKAVVG